MLRSGIILAIAAVGGNFPGYCQVLHHHPDHLHNPVHAEIITKHFGDTDVQFEHDVIILTKDNFYYMVGAHEILLALFGVPWDPKYNEVLLEFEKAAGILQRDHPSICLGRMDVSSHPEITKKMDIRGEQPQFMFFYKNRAYSFEHSWKADAIVKEMIKRQEAVWYPPQNLPEHLNELEPTVKAIERVANKDFSVVLLYSPTRLSSLRLMMELENAVALLNRTDTFFKINVADVKELRHQYGLPPVLKIFRKGKAYDYKGPKVTKGMVNYLRGQMQPPFVRALTPQEVEDFLTKHQDKPTVLGYFDTEKLPQFQLFTEAANVLRGELYFVVIRQYMSSPGWKEKLDEEKWRVGVILPKRDSDPEIVKAKDVTITESLKTLEELLGFITYKSIPVVGTRTRKNQDGLQFNRKPLVVCYIKVDWSKTGERATMFTRHRIAQVAVEYPVGKLTFVISDKDEFKDELERFGFTDLNEEKEIRMGIMGADGEMYPLHNVERVTSAEIKQFAEDFLAGKLKPFYRSEKPLPLEENTDPLKIVSGQTFNDLVQDNEKDVLISFCHPLCGICKTVEDNLMTIAKKQEYATTDFLAMDASLNDPPATYAPKSYPTILFASAKDKKAPVKYNGKDYSVKEFYKFLDKNVSKPRTLKKSEL